MMIRIDQSNQANQPGQSRQIQVRLPYAPPEGVGLGDVVARITQALGVRPCQPCKQRQEALNQHVRLMPW